MSEGNILHQAGQLVAGNVNFDVANDLVVYTGMAVPTALAAGIIAREYFRGSKPVHDGIIGAEDDAITAMESAPQNRLRSVVGKRATMLALASATTFGIPALLSPYTTEEVTVPGSEAVFVVDLSRTMTETMDMSDGSSRLDAVSTAMTLVMPDMPDDLRVGLITFGEQSDVVVPLTTDRNLLNIPTSDQTEGQAFSFITEGVNLGQSTLKGSDNTASDIMFVVSDGTVDKQEDMTSALIESAESGTKVAIIVTGTKEGTYSRTEFDPSPTASAVNPETFSVAAEHKNIEVFEATSPLEIQEIIQENIDNATKKDINTPFTLFRNLAVGLGAVGYLIETFKGIKGARKKNKENKEIL